MDSDRNPPPPHCGFNPSKCLFFYETSLKFHCDRWPHYTDAAVSAPSAHSQLCRLYKQYWSPVGCTRLSLGRSLVGCFVLHWTKILVRCCSPHSSSCKEHGPSVLCSIYIYIFFLMGGWVTRTFGSTTEGPGMINIRMIRNSSKARNFLHVSWLCFLFCYYKFGAYCPLLAHVRGCRELFSIETV